jgi:hypothetical protein
MALPKQIEQDIRDIEEIERALTVKSEPTAEPNAEPPQIAPDPAPAPEAPTEPTTATSNVVELPSSENWEQKYKSLQGHFDREVPRLHQQNRELAGQLQALQQRIDELSRKPEAPTKPEPLSTAEDDDAYGADLMSAVRRAAADQAREAESRVAQQLAERDKRIAQLEQLLGKTGQEVSSLTFEQQLARAVPDFEAINTDPRWIAWLQEIDPFTGHPRQSYASYVYDQGNVEAVKKIVDLYKSMSAPAVTQQQTQQTQRQSELQRQVQPSPVSASSPPTPNTKDRVYTEAEATRLFNKVRDLNVAGKYEEANQLENELSLAYMQGRVRP